MLFLVVLALMAQSVNGCGAIPIFVPPYPHPSSSMPSVLATSLEECLSKYLDSSRKMLSAVERQTNITALYGGLLGFPPIDAVNPLNHFLSLKSSSETNVEVLRSLLFPLPPFTTPLASAPRNATSLPSSLSTATAPSDDENESPISPAAQLASYESASQGVTHLARDWNAAATSLRPDYKWILSRFASYVLTPESSSAEITVLLPGAGAGRLSFEMYKAHVDSGSKAELRLEVNDCSALMVVLSHRMLSRSIEAMSSVEGGEASPPITAIIFPRVEQTLAGNELFKSNRLLACSISSFVPKRPPAASSPLPPNPSRFVSFQFGDFTSIYSLPSYRSRYSSVTTSFFIDTATTVFEYLAVLRHVLSPGGIWLNVGPLQWHFGSNVFLTADELRATVEGMGFTVLEWELGPGEGYRDASGDGDSDGGSLKIEGYRALRFVARKSEAHGMSEEGGGTRTSLVNALKIGRKAVEDMKLSSDFPDDEKQKDAVLAGALEIDVIE